MKLSGNRYESEHKMQMNTTIHTGDFLYIKENGYVRPYKCSDGEPTDFAIARETKQSKRNHPFIKVYTTSPYSMFIRKNYR